jgi:hypothetical protein
VFNTAPLISDKPFEKSPFGIIVGSPNESLRKSASVGVVFPFLGRSPPEDDAALPGRRRMDGAGASGTSMGILRMLRFWMTTDAPVAGVGRERIVSACRRRRVALAEFEEGKEG